jgi:DNA-binding Xre family transcriptional regulator
LKINGQVIKVCDDYKYLGVAISGEGSNKTELSNRISQAKQAINKLNSISWANNIKKQTRKKICDSSRKHIAIRIGGLGNIEEGQTKPGSCRNGLYEKKL